MPTLTAYGISADRLSTTGNPYDSETTKFGPQHMLLFQQDNNWTQLPELWAGEINPATGLWSSPAQQVDTGLLPQHRERGGFPNGAEWGTQLSASAEMAPGPVKDLVDQVAAQVHTHIGITPTGPVSLVYYPKVRTGDIEPLLPAHGTPPSEASAKTGVHALPVDIWVAGRYDGTWHTRRLPNTEDCYLLDASQSKVLSRTILTYVRKAPGAIWTDGRPYWRFADDDFNEELIPRVYFGRLALGANARLVQDWYGLVLLKEDLGTFKLAYRRIWDPVFRNAVLEDTEMDTGIPYPDDTYAVPSVHSVPTEVGSTADSQMYWLYAQIMKGDGSTDPNANPLESWLVCFKIEVDRTTSAFISVVAGPIELRPSTVPGLKPIIVDTEPMPFDPAQPRFSGVDPYHGRPVVLLVLGDAGVRIGQGIAPSHRSQIAAVTIPDGRPEAWRELATPATGYAKDTEWMEFNDPSGSKAYVYTRVVEDFSRRMRGSELYRLQHV